MTAYLPNVQPLLERAIESLILAIELFNRPTETARAHAVTMLLHHAFELGLKAAILQRGKSILDSTSRYTIGFDKCLALAEGELKLLSDNERATLVILDAQRDHATHYYVEMSEDILYVLAQSSVTLFDRVLRTAFKEALADRLPTRILPLSTHPPRDLQLLLTSELTEVDEFLAKGSNESPRAAAKLRSILAFTSIVRQDSQRVSESELTDVIARRREGKDWSVILPEVGQMELSTDGTGIPMRFVIAKQGVIPVRIAQPGETPEGVVVKQEVNLFDKFNLGRDELAAKLGITGPKTSALIIELNICNDTECYREMTLSSNVWKRYSRKALDCLRNAIENGLNVDEVWRKHRSKFTGPRMQQRLRRNTVTKVRNSLTNSRQGQRPPR